MLSCNALVRSLLAYDAAAQVLESFTSRPLPPIPRWRKIGGTAYGSGASHVVGYGAVERRAPGLATKTEGIEMGTILALIALIALVPMFVSAGAALDRYIGKKHVTGR